MGQNCGCDCCFCGTGALLSKTCFLCLEVGSLVSPIRGYRWVRRSVMEHKVCAYYECVGFVLSLFPK